MNDDPKAKAALPPSERRGERLLTDEMEDAALARRRAGWTWREIQEYLAGRFGYTLVQSALHRRVSKKDDLDRAEWAADTARINWDRQPLGLVPEVEIAEFTGAPLSDVIAALEARNIPHFEVDKT